MTTMYVTSQHIVYPIIVFGNEWDIDLPSEQLHGELCMQSTDGYKIGQNLICLDTLIIIN